MKTPESQNNLNRGAQFLHEKYPKLSTSGAVKSAAWWTGETLNRKPEERVKALLNFFNNIIEAKKPEEKERGLSAMKRLLHQSYVIKPEGIPESYFNAIKRRHREEGHGDIEIPADYRREQAETIIKDQENSLDNWVDYLSSPDAKYPVWLKYFVFRNIVKMGHFDKKKKEFTERTKGTTGPFPERNREALAIALEAIEQDLKGEMPKFGYDIQEDTKAKFMKFLKQKNFAKLYGVAIEEFKPIEEKLLKITEGKWVKYPRGSDPKKLVESISDYGTGWCLRGEAVARRYLATDKNDLHVYYSNNEKGRPVVPRVVMVINQNDKIAEVRGVAPEENLDPHIGDVVKKKLAEFPDGKEYEKKTEDMKKLTLIDNRAKDGQELAKDDLIFLYEINFKIEGFGYQKDPRVKELLSRRDPLKDAPIVLGFQPEQIAHNEREINKETKAYIGELYQGIFDKLANVEHIHTSFPEEKIMQKEITIGGKTAKELAKEIKEKGDKIDEYTEKKLMVNKDFKPLKKAEKLNLVILSVKDLGFPNGATTREIYEKAQELDLKLVPAEVGPQLRLQYEDQPMGEWLLIGMEPLTVSSGHLSVFLVHHDDYGRWLYYYDGYPGTHWDSGNRWVFARK